jgi:hypothetical protein
MNMPCTVVSEHRFAAYRSLRSMRELSEQLEDSLQKLVDARLLLLSSLEHCMSPEAHQAASDSISLGVRLETLYLANERQIACIENLLRESP